MSDGMASDPTLYETRVRELEMTTQAATLQGIAKEKTYADVMTFIGAFQAYKQPVFVFQHENSQGSKSVTVFAHPETHGMELTMYMGARLYHMYLQLNIVPILVDYDHGIHHFEALRPLACHQEMHHKMVNMIAEKRGSLRQNMWTDHDTSKPISPTFMAGLGTHAQQPYHSEDDKWLAISTELTRADKQVTSSNKSSMDVTMQDNGEMQQVADTSVQPSDADTHATSSMIVTDSSATSQANEDAIATGLVATSSQVFHPDSSRDATHSLAAYPHALHGLDRFRYLPEYREFTLDHQGQICTCGAMMSSTVPEVMDPTLGCQGPICERINEWVDTADSMTPPSTTPLAQAALVAPQANQDNGGMQQGTIVVMSTNEYEEEKSPGNKPHNKERLFSKLPSKTPVHSHQCKDAKSLVGLMNHGETRFGLRIMAVIQLHNEVVMTINQGSLPSCDTDAIVNSANTTGLPGGGVDRAISEEGGDELANARQALPFLEGSNTHRIKVGDAVTTTAGGSLNCSYVFHAVASDCRDCAPEQWGLLNELTKNAYAACVREAEELVCYTIAIPLLGAGVFRGDMPLEATVGLALWSLINESAHMMEHSLKEIALVAHKNEEATTLMNVLPTFCTNGLGGVWELKDQLPSLVEINLQVVNSLSDNSNQRDVDDNGNNQMNIFAECDQLLDGGLYAGSPADDDLVGSLFGESLAESEPDMNQGTQMVGSVIQSDPSGVAGGEMASPSLLAKNGGKRTPHAEAAETPGEAEAKGNLTQKTRGQPSQHQENQNSKYDDQKATMDMPQDEKASPSKPTMPKDATQEVMTSKKRVQMAAASAASAMDAAAPSAMDAAAPSPALTRKRSGQATTSEIKRGGREETPPAGQPSKKKPKSGEKKHLLKKWDGSNLAELLPKRAIRQAFVEQCRNTKSIHIVVEESTGLRVHAGGYLNLPIRDGHQAWLFEGGWGNITKQQLFLFGEVAHVGNLPRLKVKSMEPRGRSEQIDLSQHVVVVVGSLRMGPSEMQTTSRNAAHVLVMVRAFNYETQHPEDGTRARVYRVEDHHDLHMAIHGVTSDTKAQHMNKDHLVALGYKEAVTEMSVVLGWRAEDQTKEDLQFSRQRPVLGQSGFFLDIHNNKERGAVIGIQPTVENPDEMMFLIRFDDWNVDYDEWVSAEKIVCLINKGDAGEKETKEGTKPRHKTKGPGGNVTKKSQQETKDQDNMTDMSDEISSASGSQPRESPSHPTQAEQAQLAKQAQDAHDQRLKKERDEFMEAQQQQQEMMMQEMEQLKADLAEKARQMEVEKKKLEDDMNAERLRFAEDAERKKREQLKQEEAHKQTSKAKQAEDTEKKRDHDGTTLPPMGHGGMQNQGSALPPHQHTSLPSPSPYLFGGAPPANQTMHIASDSHIEFGPAPTVRQTMPQPSPGPFRFGGANRADHTIDATSGHPHQFGVTPNVTHSMQQPSLGPFQFGGAAPANQPMHATSGHPHQFGVTPNVTHSMQQPSLGPFQFGGAAPASQTMHANFGRSQFGVTPNVTQTMQQSSVSSSQLHGGGLTPTHQRMGGVPAYGATPSAWERAPDHDMLDGTATTNQTKDRACTHGHQPTYLGGGAPGNMMSTWQSGSESDPRRQAQVQRTQGRGDISTSHQVSPTPDESEIQKNAEMEKQQANLEKQLKELKEREENMRKREREMQEQAALVNMQQQEVMQAMQPSEPSNLLMRGKGKGKGKGKGSMPPSGMGAQVQHHHYVQHPPGNVTPQGYRIDQHQQINDVHRRRENYLVTQSHNLEARRLQELTLAGFNEEIRGLERTPPAGHWPRSAAPAARYWQQMPQGSWMRWDDTHGECDPDTYNQDNFF